MLARIRYNKENRNLIMNSDMYIAFISEGKEGVNYFNNYGASNIKNLFYLFVLPYTFGILIAKMCFDFRIKYANKINNKILKSLMESEYLTDGEIIQLRKKYSNYGGNQLNFDMYQKIFIQLKDR